MENNDNNEFSYVQEKIKPKNKKRLKKILTIGGTTIVCAIVFGFVARFMFTVSDGAVNKLLGITSTPTPTPFIDDKRNKISLEDEKKPTATPIPTAVPDITPTAEAENTPQPVTLDPVPTIASPTPTPEVVPTSAATEENAVDSYIRMMNELKGIADKGYTSLVRMYAVTTGINWMDESVETRHEVTGLVMADNGVELLILADYSTVADADRIEVEFFNKQIAEGKLYSFNKDYELCVVAVSLENIDEKTKSHYKYAKLGESGKLYEGQPIIAIGRPNGYYGSVLFGFVSKTGMKKFVIDGEAGLLTTDISFDEGSDGVIISLDGTVQGLIGAVARVDSATEQCAEIDGMKDIIVRLLNAEDFYYFGIRAEDIPESVLMGLELDHGIYINEVLIGSPAYLAGIKKGDIITALRNVEIQDDGISPEGDQVIITSMADFSAFLMNVKPDQHIETQVFRSSKREEPNMLIHVQITKK